MKAAGKDKANPVAELSILVLSVLPFIAVVSSGKSD